jgi:hypothetical protein
VYEGRPLHSTHKNSLIYVIGKDILSGGSVAIKIHNTQKSRYFMTNEVKHSQYLTGLGKSRSNLNSSDLYCLFSLSLSLSVSLSVSLFVSLFSLHSTLYLYLLCLYCHLLPLLVSTSLSLLTIGRGCPNGLMVWETRWFEGLCHAPPRRESRITFDEAKWKFVSHRSESDCHHNPFYCQTSSL